jgi:transcriptional regulator GlxA family with amidase domain
MDYRIRHLIAYIEHEITGSLSVDRMARIAGTSHSGLRTLFRRYVGVTPHRFVKKLRLERARVMLCSEVISVKEAMSAVGYSDFSHFVRDFERAYGLSPRRYRREFFR